MLFVFTEFNSGKTKSNAESQHTAISKIIANFCLQVQKYGFHDYSNMRYRLWRVFTNMYCGLPKWINRMHLL